MKPTMQFIIFLTGIIASLLHAPCAFSNKKQSQILLGIYDAHRYTFYCDEPFSAKGKVISPICAHCPKQTLNIQWVPIVPYSKLTEALLCSKEKVCVHPNGKSYKGLNCCKKHDTHFQRMSQDLHNFVPELNAVHQIFKKRHFGEVKQSDLSDLTCHIKIDNELKIIEPSAKNKGMIARTYLYMRDKYYLPLTAQETLLFQKWHQAYPASAWEKERNLKIKAIQGDSNPYVSS